MTTTKHISPAIAAGNARPAINPEAFSKRLATTGEYPRDMMPWCVDMMSKARTRDEILMAAGWITETLSEYDGKATRNKVLEASAALFGFRNWDVLSAKSIAWTVGEGEADLKDLPTFPTQYLKDYPGGANAYRKAIVTWMERGAILTLSMRLGMHLHYWSDDVPVSERVYWADHGRCGYTAYPSKQNARPLKAVNIRESHLVMLLQAEDIILIDPSYGTGRCNRVDAILVPQIAASGRKKLIGEPANRVEALLWLQARIEAFAKRTMTPEEAGNRAAYKRRFEWITQHGCRECRGGENQPFMDRICGACGGTGYGKAPRRSAKGDATHGALEASITA